MADEQAEVIKPNFFIRDIIVRDVPMTVAFWYHPAIESSEASEGCSDEIEIQGVYIDEFDVINLIGSKALAEIEGELWKLLDNKEEL